VLRDVQVLVVTASMCRAVASAAALVVVLGTQFFDSSGLGGEDYPVAELIQMLGLSSRPDKDAEGTCVLMCHTAKKEFYKKFLFEPLPIESQLDVCLHDHIVRAASLTSPALLLCASACYRVCCLLRSCCSDVKSQNTACAGLAVTCAQRQCHCEGCLSICSFLQVAEAVVGTITNKQETVDWLTYTFFYRRLPQNPNYYNMMGRSHRHIRDHLSELVEDVCTVRAPPACAAACRICCSACLPADLKLNRDALVIASVYQHWCSQPHTMQANSSRSASIRHLLTTHLHVQELSDAHAILVDESGLGISPENLGIITAYHHISFKTAHTCFEHLNAKSKMKSLLQVLSHATEFDALPIRPGDDVAIARILKHARFAVQSTFADARSKANALLQAHFARTPLRGDLAADQEKARSRQLAPVA
jgi:Sec63 Brl domain